MDNVSKIYVNKTVWGNIVDLIWRTVGIWSRARVCYLSLPLESSEIRGCVCMYLVYASKVLSQLSQMYNFTKLIELCNSFSWDSFFWNCQSFDLWLIERGCIRMRFFYCYQAQSWFSSFPMKKNDPVTLTISTYLSTLTN